MDVCQPIAQIKVVIKINKNTGERKLTFEAACTAIPCIACVLHDDRGNIDRIKISCEDEKEKHSIFLALTGNMNTYCAAPAAPAFPCPPTAEAATMLLL